MSKTLLAVVADDPLFLQAITPALEANDYQVLLLAQPETAVAEIQKARPLLVLLDIHLGSGLTSWDLLAELREQPDTAHIPVLIIAADTSTVVRGAAPFATGQVDVLEKPFDLEVLQNKIQKLLSSAESL